MSGVVLERNKANFVYNYLFLLYYVFLFPFCCSVTVTVLKLPECLHAKPFLAEQ